MRVDTIQLHLQQGKPLPVFIKGGLYHAVVQEQLGNNLFSIKIQGSVLTAASEMILQDKEGIFVRVKSLSPLPVLELVNMEKVLPKLFESAEPKLAAFFKTFLQIRLPGIVIKSPDTELTKEFLQEQSELSKIPVSPLLTNEKEADDILRHAQFDKIISQEYGEKGMFFMAFPYVENELLRDGYFSYTPKNSTGMEEYRIMAELSSLGTILAVVRQWHSTIGIHMYTATEDSARIIQGAFRELRTALHEKGISVASLTVKHSGILHDPILMLAFQCEEGIDVVV